MGKYHRNNIPADVVSFLFILLFIYAAANKLITFHDFRVQLGKSPVITSMASWMVWMVPLTEILIALLLIPKKTQLPALYASFTLMVMFTVYIIIILKFSYYIPCSCGGVLQRMGWKQHLVFNIGFVLAGAAGVLLYPDRKTKSL